MKRTTPDETKKLPGRTEETWVLKEKEWMDCAGSTKRVHVGPQTVIRTVWMDGGRQDDSDKQPSLRLEGMK